LNAPETVTVRTAAGREREVRIPGPGSLRGRRILFVLGSLDMGGAERQAMLLARHLAEEEGSEVEVWGLGPPGPVSRICDAAALKWRSMAVDPGPGRLRTLARIARFARELRRSRAEVAVPYTLVPNVLCCAGSIAPGTPATHWNQRDAGIGQVGRRLEKWSVRRARRIVSNSRTGALHLAGRHRLDPDRILIVPNGVAIPAPAGRDTERLGRLGIAPGAFLIGMIANLHANKDHATLVRAMRAVVDRWPLPDRPCHLLLAGRDGETRPALEALVRALDLGARVHFLGAVDDVAGLLAELDLGVLSSREEACPNGVLECMAAGLAVVGTDNEGIREVLGEGSGRFLAPPGDDATLGGRILAVAGDAALRARAGEENRARVAGQFDPRRMCRTMAGLILETLEGRP
jgi:glycosyltransferase involved in cell wall biosynthesis